MGCMCETGFFGGKMSYFGNAAVPQMTATVVHKKSTRGRGDILNTFCLFALHIRIATIVREKFDDKFLFWYYSAIATKFEVLSNSVI